MGVARRANRKFRYSRTELGNHYTGVEANNKRVSYNAYLLDFLKTSLRAEFMRLFYRFSYGLKSEVLRSAAVSYSRYSRGMRARQFRVYWATKKKSIRYFKIVNLWLRERVVGWRFSRHPKTGLKKLLGEAGSLSALDKAIRFKHRSKVGVKKLKKKQITVVKVVSEGGGL